MIYAHRAHRNVVIISVMHPMQNTGDFITVATPVVLRSQRLSDQEDTREIILETMNPADVEEPAFKDRNIYKHPPILYHYFR